MASSCSLAYSLVLPGPSLALFYGVSVLGFRAGWHECGWGSMNASLALRLAFLTAAVASSVSSCQTEAPLAASVPVGAACWVLSLWIMRQTRVVHVEGPRPKFESNVMKDKVVLVTGANAGIGRETVRQLVMLGATILMGCRNENRAKEAIDDILASCEPFERASIEARLRFLVLDLSDFSSVRRAASAFLDMDLPLHVLINNAGVMMGSKQTTKDGYELTMQANHLGHFLLTVLLLPKLEETDESRVLTITSSTYVLAASGFNFDDMFCDSARAYSLFGQYAQSKLANVLFCKELALRYHSIISLCVHPGLVRTDVVRNMPWYLRYPNIAFAWILAALQKAPAQGAYTSVWCAATKDTPPNGSYLANSKVMPTTTFANNEEDAKRLWEISERLVGVKAPFPKG